jgi:hypothetical protein
MTSPSAYQPSNYLRLTDQALVLVILWVMTVMSQHSARAPHAEAALTDHDGGRGRPDDVRQCPAVQSVRPVPRSRHTGVHCQATGASVCEYTVSERV